MQRSFAFVTLTGPGQGSRAPGWPGSLCEASVIPLQHLSFPGPVLDSEGVLDVRGLRDRPDQTLYLSESLVGVWKKPGLTDVVSEAGRGVKGDNLARMWALVSHSSAETAVTQELLYFLEMICKEGVFWKVPMFDSGKKKKKEKRKKEKRKNETVRVSILLWMQPVLETTD